MDLRWRSWRRLWGDDLGSAVVARKIDEWRRLQDEWRCYNSSESWASMVRVQRAIFEKYMAEDTNDLG